jgi:hypothetical protein
MTVATAAVVDETLVLPAVCGKRSPDSAGAARPRGRGWRGAASAYAAASDGTGSKQARSGNVQRSKGAGVGRVCGAGRYCVCHCSAAAARLASVRQRVWLRGRVTELSEGGFVFSGSELRSLRSSRGERSTSPVPASRRRPNNRAAHSVMHRPQCARERIETPNVPGAEAHERKDQRTSTACNECGGNGRSKAQKDAGSRQLAAAQWEQERGSRAVGFSSAHIKSQPWWRAILQAAQWIAGPIRAHHPCIRQLLWADHFGCCRASPGSDRCTVHGFELVSVGRSCTGIYLALAAPLNLPLPHTHDTVD